MPATRRHGSAGQVEDLYRGLQAEAVAEPEPGAGDAVAAAGAAAARLHPLIRPHRLGPGGEPAPLGPAGGPADARRHSAPVLQAGARACLLVPVR